MAWLWDHLEEAALVCQVVAFLLLARAWWGFREAAKLRKKAQDYRGKP